MYSVKVGALICNQKEKKCYLHSGKLQIFHQILEKQKQDGHLSQELLKGLLSHFFLHRNSASHLRWKVQSSCQG